MNRDEQSKIRWLHRALPRRKKNKIEGVHCWKMCTRIPGVDVHKRAKVVADGEVFGTDGCRKEMGGHRWPFQGVAIGGFCIKLFLVLIGNDQSAVLPDDICRPAFTVIYQNLTTLDTQVV